MQPLATRAKRLGLKARFTGDPAIARHILDGLEHWKDRGAALPPRLDVRPIPQPRPDLEVAAYFIPFAKPLLQIDPVFYALRLADGHLDREHVPAGPYGLLLHEIGHFAHWTHTGGDGGDYLDLAERPPLAADEQQLARRVSARAQEHPCEFVAECFAGLSIGLDYPADVLALYDRYGGPEPLTGIRSESIFNERINS
jgi:hypothetical protein